MSERVRDGGSERGRKEGRKGRKEGKEGRKEGRKGRKEGRAGRKGRKEGKKERDCCAPNLFVRRRTHVIHGAHLSSSL